MSTVLETGIVTVGSQDTQQLGMPPPSHTGDLCFSKGKLNEESVFFLNYILYLQNQTSFSPSTPTGLI